MIVEQEPKEYDIKTMQDIIDATSYNTVDLFLEDLRAFLLNVHHAQNVKRTKLYFKEFKWIDDGKHNHEFNVFVTNEKED